MIILSLQGIRKSFGTHEVLKDASLTLQDGERMGLVGVNGSGKSTLMKIIAGQETADGGTLSLQKGMRIGYLAQQGELSGEETVLFAPGNILAAWYYSHGQNGFDLNVLGLAEIPEEDRKEASRPLISRRFQGVDGWEVSEMVQLSHDQILRQVMERRKTDPSYVPATVATIPQLRMTRRIAGISTMDTADDHVEKPDSIGLIGNWKKAGPVYAVPFSALHGHGIRNLITAGRSISATDAMWDVTRVIPACAVTGQAAGTAAAMTGDFSQLSVETLQKVLLEDGVRLTLGEIGLTGKS